MGWAVEIVMVLSSKTVTSGCLVPDRVKVISPVLAAPVSTVPALFATVPARPGPFRPVKTASSGSGGGLPGGSVYRASISLLHAADALGSIR